MPNPPQKDQTALDKSADKPAKDTVEPEKESRASVSGIDGDGENIDFARAFDEDVPDTMALVYAQQVREKPLSDALLQASAKVSLVSHRVRVAIHENISSIKFFSTGPIFVNSGAMQKKSRGGGSYSISVTENGRIAFEIPGYSRFIAALPCTLRLAEETGIIRDSHSGYRGQLVFIEGRPGSITIVNYLPVETYLRGVVPLEMGKHPATAIEALKAQAVVARTYTYKRMQARSEALFDVVATVADQVYGGADAENDVADSAIRQTCDQVVTHEDTLCTTYYFSTCAGRTANVNDVWNYPPVEYLASIDDRDSRGRVYCSFSSAYEWEESWTGSDLSHIVRICVPRTYPGLHFSGSLKKIKPGNRFTCGRLKTCELFGTQDKIVCRGDKIRFVLHRKNASGPILRSANFAVVKNGPHTFEVRGNGYGHGVGMCQMGALGRAKVGESCEQIVKAYFRNSEIKRIEECGKRVGDP